jgi:hypothetical protein
MEVRTTIKVKIAATWAWVTTAVKKAALYHVSRESETGREVQNL